MFKFVFKFKSSLNIVKSSPFATCVIYSNFYIQVRPSKFTFMKVMSIWIFGELSRFFSQGLETQ
jgi:hypothetical protein